MVRSHSATKTWQSDTKPNHIHFCALRVFESTQFAQIQLFHLVSSLLTKLLSPLKRRNGGVAVAHSPCSNLLGQTLVDITRQNLDGVGSHGCTGRKGQARNGGDKCRWSSSFFRVRVGCITCPTGDCDGVAKGKIKGASKGVTDGLKDPQLNEGALFGQFSSFLDPLGFS